MMEVTQRRLRESRSDTVVVNWLYEWKNRGNSVAKSMMVGFLHPRPPNPCLQLPRFRRRSVSRDVRGQAGAGASIGTVTCGKGGRGESHGAHVERHTFLSSLPLAAGPGSVEPCKWQAYPERTGANEATQRGEMITCRGRKPRKNAEGHANAEPLFTTIIRGSAFACASPDCFLKPRQETARDASVRP